MKQFSSSVPPRIGFFQGSDNARRVEKRMVKSPKLYWNDTGLAAHLCGIPSVEALRGNLMMGRLMETLLIMEIQALLPLADEPASSMLAPATDSRWTAPAAGNQGFPHGDGFGRSPHRTMAHLEPDHGEFDGERGEAL